MLDDLWSALGGDRRRARDLHLRRSGPILPSPLDVEGLLTAAAGSALLAAAELAEVRTGRAPAVALDVDGLAVAAASERWVRRDGEVVGAAFDPLSAFLPAADGWVRLHGNYAWHRAALVRALGAGAPDAVPAAVRARPALEVETAVVAAGGCAAAVRTGRTWRSSPPGDAVGPVVARDAGPPTGRRLAPSRSRDLPAAGVRVLDLTRVIAGPVATRTLAALGADVVRVDDPRRPELPVLALDGGLGKRRLELDLRAAGDRAGLEGELAAADVLVAGHRPGALDAFGLGADHLAVRHPHLVVATLSAWGERGPWGGRRGFDSLVQAATGVAEAVRPASETEPPGALPVQALDHGTGHLLAAAVLRALTERERTGRAGRARLALAATAHRLLDAGRRDPAGPREVDAGPHLVSLGRLQVAAPPGELDGEPLRWPEGRPGRVAYA